MEQSPKICPKCHQANFPIAEFCRHCGEPIFEMGSLSRTSFFSRLIGHFIDGAFWFLDEIIRWWEISRLSRTLKKLQKKRANLMSHEGGSGMSEECRLELLRTSEDMTHVAGREEALRRKSWSYTPELLLVMIVLLFSYGVWRLNPETGRVSAPLISGSAVSFQGALTQVQEINVPRQTVVTSAAWYGNRLYIGGDGGLSAIDLAQGGAATFPVGLPKNFFVRHLSNDSAGLLIAGYGGVFGLDPAGIRAVYDPLQMPVQLVNRIVPLGDGHLMATLGQGLLKGRRGLATLLLGAAGLTVKGFAWLDGELWLLHERGLLRGDGSTFTSVQIPVLTDKRLTSIAATGNALYIGTTEGLIAAYKSPPSFGERQSWVWTPLASGGPKLIHDLAVSGTSLLLCAEEGLFRLDGGVYERVSNRTGQKIIAAGPEFIATIGLEKAILYRPSGLPAVGAPVASPILPTVGTFAQTIASLPIPLVSAPPGPVPLVTAQPQPVPVSPLPGNPAPVTTSLPTQSPAPGANPVVLFDNVAIPQGMIGKTVSAAIGDVRRLILGTNQAGIWMYDNGTWKNFTRETGELADNQINSLMMIQGKPHLFGLLNGLMSLESGRPVVVLDPGKSKGLAAITADANSLVALFEGGGIFRIRNGNLESVGQVPDDLQKSLRFLHVVDGVFWVVADQGIIVQTPRGDFTFTWFLEGPSVKTVATIMGEPGKIYLAKADGNIYAFANNKMEKLGNIGEKPAALAFENGNLWVAGTRSIFRRFASTLSPLSQKSADIILGFRFLPEKQSILVLTASGIQVFPYNQ